MIEFVPFNKRNNLREWIKGKNNKLDKNSKEKVYELIESGIIDDIEVGTINGLQQIHAFIFGGLYDFAGKIRSKTISKDGFVFANGDFLLQVLKDIENIPQSSFDEIVTKYAEMNIAHPFMEGNGRSTRIWLDLIFKKELKQCVDWSKLIKNI